MKAGISAAGRRSKFRGFGNRPNRMPGITFDPGMLQARTGLRKPHRPAVLFSVFHEANADAIRSPLWSALLHIVRVCAWGTFQPGPGFGRLHFAQPAPGRRAQSCVDANHFLNQGGELPGRSWPGRSQPSGGEKLAQNSKTRHNGRAAYRPEPGN